MTDGVENLLFVVLAEELVDVGELLSDGLLEYPERNGDGLQILGSGGHVNVDGLEAGVVNDRGLG